MNIKSTIVVAKYKEDISWTSNTELQKHCNITIYDKSINSIPNIGREAHTYIYHIVNNYNNLDKDSVTLFTQGSIIDHNESPQSILDMIQEAYTQGFSQSRAKWHDIPIHYQPLESFRILEFPSNTPLQPNKYNESYKVWFERALKQRFPNIKRFRWVIAAIFAVKNSQILKKPLKYYQDLLSEFDHETTPNSETAHFFERSWYYVFLDKPFYISKVPEYVNILIANENDENNKKINIIIIQIDDRGSDSNIKKHQLVWEEFNEQISAEYVERFRNNNPDLFTYDNVTQVIPRAFAYKDQIVTIKMPWNKLIPEYHILTHMYNKIKIKTTNIDNINFNYKFFLPDPNPERHASWKKYNTILKYWEEIKNYDVVVILDSDAWIKDIENFGKWLTYFYNCQDKFFMFSAEPYLDVTYWLLDIQQDVNGGLTILKPNEFTKKSLETIYELPNKVHTLSKFKLDWSFEQIILSYYLNNNKEFLDSILQVPVDMFNTPNGSIVTHCWFKYIIPQLIIPDLWQYILDL